MKQKLFVDTSFLCALYNPDDSLHAKATKIAPTLTDFYFVISNFILLESYTVISQRLSKQHTFAFREEMYNTDYYSISWIKKDFEGKIWKIFTSIKDKNFSYVDASILAVLKHEKIFHLLSFDRTFKQFEKDFKFTLIPA